MNKPSKKQIKKAVAAIAIWKVQGMIDAYISAAKRIGSLDDSGRPIRAAEAK